MRNVTLSIDQINSTLNSAYSTGAQGGLQQAANVKSSGGSGFNFGRDILPGIIFVGGSALGAYGLDSALSAAAASQAAGAVGGSAGGAAGGIGDVFAGWSPTGSLAGTASGTVGSYGAGAAGAAGAADIGLGTNAPLQGPTYGELGITGVPEGGMGPTYGEMGYTGLNQQAAINAANAGAQTSTSMADALKTANQVRQVAGTANTLSKLLTQGGGAGSALAGAAQNLATGQTGVGSAIPALVRGNQNPFLQSAQQPIRSSSDLTSLANLLKQG